MAKTKESESYYVPEFNSHYNRYRQPPEYNRGELITEQAGYISPQRQIESMIAAGIRLEDYRMSQVYDFNDSNQVDEDYEDVTRRPGFDPADASQIANSLRARVLANEKKAKRLAKEKKLKEAANGRTKENVGPDPVRSGERDPGDHSGSGAVASVGK